MHIEGNFHLLVPRNMSAGEWEREAFNAIVRDRERHVDQFHWIKFWENTCVWKWQYAKIMIKVMEDRAVTLAEFVETEKQRGRGWEGRVGLILKVARSQRETPRQPDTTPDKKPEDRTLAMQLNKM